MHHTVFGQAKGNDGCQYGKAGENKRKYNIKAYVKAGMFHGVLSDNIEHTG